jgi:hypothetical protein
MSREYQLTPFFLLDRDLERSVTLSREARGDSGVALYVPYLASSNERDIRTEAVQRLWRYALRRQWVQQDMAKRGHNLRLLEASMQKNSDQSESFGDDVIEALAKSVDRLSVAGPKERFMRAFGRFRRLGIDTIIGLPLVEEREQTAAFSQYLREFQEQP